MGQQGAADRHPLLLAAGERVGPPLEQSADAKQVDDRAKIGRRAIVVAAGEPASIEQVAAHAEMGEQPAVLEDIADSPAMLGNERAAPGVDQHLAVDGDLAAVGPDQAADDIDQRGLARARAAEQRRQARRRREARAELEAVARMVEVDVEAHAAICRTPMRRASSSEPSSAAMEIAIDTRVSLSAPESPPGICVRV